MKLEASTVYLYNVARKEPELAELWDVITEKQLDDWEGEWLPELFNAIQRLKHAGVERTRWPQNLHWDWRRKAESIKGILANPGFSIVCDGLTQGMMIVDTAKYRSRIKSQEGQHLVYLEYVESAPWNRGELLTSPRYRGVGSILIRAAIALSEESEFKGRIGLHSLPQANEFYSNSCGMTDLGTDPNRQNLHYFEMTPEQARAFVSKGGGSNEVESQ